MTVAAGFRIVAGLFLAGTYLTFIPDCFGVTVLREIIATSSRSLVSRTDLRLVAQILRKRLGLLFLAAALIAMLASKTSGQISGRWVVETGSSNASDSNSSILGFRTLVIGGTTYFLTDFDDLHVFSIRFTDTSSGSNVGSRAVDLVDVIWFENGERVRTPVVSRGGEALQMRDVQKTGIQGGLLGPTSDVAWQDESDFGEFVPFKDEDADNRQSAFGIIYGVRSLETGATGYWSGTGDILGLSYYNYSVENRLIGPQAGVVWKRKHGPWTFETQGLTLLGYNPVRAQTTTGLGFNLNSGGLNKPVIWQPTVHGLNETYHEFSPAVELRSEVRLQITQSVSVQAMWTGIYVGNYMVASTPNLNSPTGLSQPPARPESDTLLVHHLFCGVETVW